MNYDPIFPDPERELKKRDRFDPPQIYGDAGAFVEPVPPLIPADYDPLFQVSSVASVNDCTGITPIIPCTPDEADSIDGLDNSIVPSASEPSSAAAVAETLTDDEPSAR